MALSQARQGYRVTVIGQDVHAAPFELRGVRIVPVKPFSRLSWRRLWAGPHLLRLVLGQDPDLVFLHTPELLWMGLLLKWVKKIKVVYDVHEDYAANIRAGRHYPFWLRQPLAALVRWMERFAAKRLDGVSYAESCYENMLKVPPHRSVVLRNTFSESSIGEPTVSIPTQPYMLYTGTLAREWGIFETLSLWEKLNQYQSLHLVIAGFTYDKKLLAEIQHKIAESSFAERLLLLGGDRFVPYSDIVHLIRHCRFGTALYHPLPHLRDKVPTKFFEFQALGKPLVFTPSPQWEAYHTQSPLGLPYHPHEPADAFFLRLKNWEENKHTLRPEVYSWEADVRRMANWLREIGATPTSESGQKPR